MGKFYFALAWDKTVDLHMCICKNKICIWSDPGVNLPICKYTPVSICVRMRHLVTPSKICTPEYIYTRVFLAHANRKPSEQLFPKRRALSYMNLTKI